MLFRSSVTAPADGSVYRSANVPTATGQAADGAGGTSPSGLAANSTTVTIRRNSDGAYWNGTDWQVAIDNLPTVHAATTGTTATTWTRTSGLVPWASQTDGTYTIRATATDLAGNTFSGTAITFRIDNNTPVTATVTAPVDGGIYRGASMPAAYAGAVADNTDGGGLAANAATITVRRNSDGAYWTGSA